MEPYAPGKGLAAMAELNSHMQVLNSSLDVAASQRPAFVLPRRVCGEMLLIFEIVLITCMSVVTGLLYYEIFRPGTQAEVSQLLGVGLIGAFFAVAVFYNGELYRFNRLTSVTTNLSSLLLRWTIAIFALLALAFLTKTSEDYSRGWMVAWYVGGFMALAVGRLGVKYAVQELSREGRVFARHVALVGATEIADRFCATIREREQGVAVVGLFVDDVSDPENAQGCQSLPTSGDLDDLISLAQTGRIDEIVVTLPWAAEDRIDAIVRRLSVLPVSTRLCPDKAGFRFADCAYSDLGGVQLLEAHRRPLEGWGAVMKEVEDRLLSGLALLFLAPLFLVIAIAIKLDSRGPVFFRQRRHGLNHSVFHIYKFRTMTVQDDGETVAQATKDDKRVTKVGKFLRRSSLDELPQLINVLLGDMSLVGPRPHALAHNIQYADLISNYVGRHKVKPGITGWAQVNGFRGETDTDEKMAGRVALDLYYIENWSLWLDFKILFLTVFAVLFPKNAY